MKELLTSLLDNRTWSVLSQNVSLGSPPQVDPLNLWQEWWHPSISIFGTLSVFLVMKVRAWGTSSARRGLSLALPAGLPLRCPVGTR